MDVVIDGRFVRDEPDLHRRLAGALGYGPYYGNDAECLRERLLAGDPRPVRLTMIHGAVIRLALGCESFDRLIEVFEEVERHDRDRPWTERFVFRLYD